MTAKFKLGVNGNFVLEAKDSSGNVIAHVGPGSNVEGEWVSGPHDQTYTITERSATEDEIQAVNNGTVSGDAKEDDETESSD